jgi:hypothetical protein
MRLMLNGYGRQQAYGLIYSPDEVTSRLAPIVTSARSFDSQVMHSAASDQFKYGWRQWWLEFSGYVAAFQDSPKIFMLQHAWNLSDELSAYEAAYALWQEKFKKEQGQPLVGPTPTEVRVEAKKKADEESIFGPGGNPLTPVLSGVAKVIPWLVGGAVLIYFGPPVVRGVQSLLASRANRRRK